MDKDTRKSKGLEGGKRKRKSTYKKDEKKSQGKQKKKDHPIENYEEPNQSKEKESETASILRPIGNYMYYSSV
jgi:FtsZ-interacting cell division protein ZipA